MQKFTRATVRQVASEIEDVLNKHGLFNGEIEFDNAGARFDDVECTFKIKGRIAGKQTRSETELETMAKVHGLDINRKGPKGEELIEYHSRKPKYPFIYKTVRGARYKCTPEQAKRMFAAQ